MEIVNTLLVTYTGVLLINVVIASLLWYAYRHSLYKLTLLVWLGIFVNFALQAVFQENTLLMVFSFSTYFFCSFYLVQILESVAEIKLFSKRHSVVFLASLIVATTFSFFEVSFTLTAIPVAVAVAYPMFEASLRVLFSANCSRGAKVYCGVLILNAIHFLDYPFLRPLPDMAVFGFSFALVLVFSLSIFLPPFVLKSVMDKYSSELEDTVERRTKALKASSELLQSANQTLSNKNKELKHLTEEHRALLSVVCHDIATPLTVMGMALEGVEMLSENQEPIDSDKMSKLLQKVTKGYRITSEILNQVRNLQKVQLGKQQIEIQSVDLFKEIKEIEELLVDKLKEKNIRLRVVSEKESGLMVQADRTLLKNSVLMNLITNAIKFSDNGSTIDIEVTKENQPKEVHLKVTDSGIGIPKEVLPTLFNFSSATAREGTRGESGTGLGLPIVKSCLDKLGAKISVESQERNERLGQKGGSTFHVYFKQAG